VQCRSAAPTLPERHTHRASLVQSTVLLYVPAASLLSRNRWRWWAGGLVALVAASAEPWQSEPRRSVPAFGFIGPASPCKYAFSLPFWVFSNPKTTTKTACFLRLHPAPVIVWISSPANRSKNARRMWPRPKRNTRQRSQALRSPPRGETGMISTTNTASFLPILHRDSTSNPLGQGIRTLGAIVMIYEMKYIYT
jgi:hypothetical protein